MIRIQKALRLCLVSLGVQICADYNGSRFGFVYAGSCPSVALFYYRVSQGAELRMLSQVEVNYGFVGGRHNASSGFQAALPHMASSSLAYLAAAAHCSNIFWEQPTETCPFPI